MSTLRPMFKFGAIDGVVRASYVMSRGTAPGMAQFTVPQGEVLPTEPTDMVWSDGFQTHVFPDCMINDVAIDNSNGELWTVTVFDRRWKWAWAVCHGNYNRRIAGEVKQSTAKNMRELATYLMDLLGEKNYDVRQVPTDVYPEVNWQYTPVKAAIEELCSAGGLVLCPQLNGTFRWCRMGDGQQLPVVVGATISESIDFAEVPDNIGVAAAPTMWQVDLKLNKPVGLEPDGRIVPIEKLSYRPKNGWGTCDLTTMSEVEEKYRKYAFESVSRWFMWELPITLPTSAEEPQDSRGRNRGAKSKLVVESFDAMLPVLDFQLEKERRGLDPNSPMVRKQSMVYGIYYDRDGTNCNTDTYFDKKSGKLLQAKGLAKDFTTDEGLRQKYKGSFSVDNELGIVKFSEPVVKLTIDGYNTLPDIRLRTAINVYLPDSHVPYRYVMKQETGYKYGTGTDWMVREDVAQEIICDRDFKLVSDSKSDVETKLNYYLGHLRERYRAKNPKIGTYDGFPRVDLDGAISQVEFSIDDQGFASTRASRDTEFSEIIPDYEQRQKSVKLSAMLKSSQVQPTKSSVK